MTLKIPARCDTPEKKLVFLLRAKEVFVQRVMNKLGQWYKTGLTQQEYDSFPNFVKNRLPYREQISKQVFDTASDILENILETRILSPYLKLRGQMENDESQDPDIDFEKIEE